jgi:hypothetical protein
MVSLTRRTAGCGPACPVVWQGRVGDHFPYADCPLFPVTYIFPGPIPLQGRTTCPEHPVERQTLSICRPRGADHRMFS